MASVFDGAIRIPTRRPLPPPNWENHVATDGSQAVWQSITGPQFMPDLAPGSEQALIYTGNQVIRVYDGERVLRVAKDAWGRIEESEHRTVNQDRELEILGNQSTVVQKDESREVAGSSELKVAQNLSGEVGQKLELEAGLQLELKGPGGSIKIDPSGITIQGTLVRINS